MELRHALETYTVLTIGDGLVTVIPALMISISGGLIVTRTGSEDSLGAEFQKQVLGASQPLLLASGVLTVLAALPGLPTIPFLALGGGLGAVAWKMRRKSVAATAISTAAAAKPKENLDVLLKMEPLSVEVGLGLVSLVERGQESPLLQRVAGIRRQLATQLGYLMPPVKVKDNIGLRSREYVIQLRGTEIARYELLQGHELATSSRNPDSSLQGKATHDPAFGLPAIWIRQDQTDLARSKGYTVVDAVSVIGTHLSELAKKHAHELFSRQDAKNFTDRVAQDNPKVVEDLVPKLLPLATVQRVLQNLLRERVAIRDSVSILEALGEAAGMTKNPVLLTEYVRQTMRRSIVRPYLSPNGDLLAFFIDPQIEQTVEAAVEHTEHGSACALHPNAIRDITAKVSRTIGAPESPVVAICSSSVRFFLRQLVEASQ